MDSMPDAPGKACEPAAPNSDTRDRQLTRKRRGAWALARRAAILTVVLGLAFLIGGFLRFATSVSTLTTPTDIRADAIVVLTGGADRIKGAVDLLAQGRAKRLLISGVHPRTSRKAIARQAHSYGDLFTCCVDLDYKAEDTIGNARQARKWVRDHGFTSLIIVTSAYHMPRSMAELKSSLPDVELKPYPVVRPNLNLDRWYEDWSTTRLLVREYVKYIAARLRLSLDIPPQAQRVFANALNVVRHGHG